MLQYLDLSQYFPQSQYQKNVLDTLQNIYVKSQWVRKSYSNGSIYFGEMIENKRNGKGMYLFESDDLYIGNWIDNKIHGKGYYVFKSGQLYHGELKHGRKHGFGKFQYKDKKIYQGYWQNDNKVGLGTVQFPNSVKFYGFFHYLHQITQGVFTRTQGQQILQYNGTLQNYDWEKNQFRNTTPSTTITNIKKNKLKQCKLDHFLTLKDDKGNIYSGQCKDGIPDGFGIKVSGGQTYEGNWKNNKEHGEGKLHVANRFIIEGIWSQGFLCEYKPKQNNP